MNSKQAVNALMDGKTVQCRKDAAQGWKDIRTTAFDAAYIGGLVLGHWWDGYEFRIKPHTVKIGNREVEAPVLEPGLGQELWYWQPDADEPKSFTYKGRNTAVSDAISYASYESCVAAHEALVLFIREQLV